MTDVSEGPNNVEADAMPERPSLAQLIRTEAVILGVGTGGVYLFSYFFQKAYLSHFGIPASFVELSLTTSVVAVSFIVFVLVSLWNLLVFFPIRPIKVLFRIAYTFFGFISIVAFAILSFWLGGFTWISIALFALFAIVLLLLGVSLIKSLRQGLSFEDWFAKQTDAEDKAREKFIGQRFLDGLGREVALLLLLLTIFPFSGGYILGKWSASRVSEFATLEVDKLTYVVISEYRDGMVLSAIHPANSKKDNYYLAGDTVWVSLASLDQRPMKVVRAFISAKPKRIPNRWTTWPVFWDRVWGLENGAARP